FTVQGFSFAGSGQNTGMAFVSLKDWSERESERLGVAAVAQRAMAAFGRIRDALVFAFAPPAVPGLGTAGGFNFYLQDNGDLGHEALVKSRDAFLAAAAQSPLLANVRYNGQEDTPQFRIYIDVARAAALGVSIADI